ncbi:hypothetical protein Tco_1517167, partial [Tanacetum coccineum]
FKRVVGSELQCETDFGLAREGPQRMTGQYPQWELIIETVGSADSENEKIEDENVGAGMYHKKPGFELRRSTMEENGSNGSKCTRTPSFSSSGLQGFNLSLDYCSWEPWGLP